MGGVHARRRGVRGAGGYDNEGLEASRTAILAELEEVEAQMKLENGEEWPLREDVWEAFLEEPSAPTEESMVETNQEGWPWSAPVATARNQCSNANDKGIWTNGGMAKMSQDMTACGVSCWGGASCVSKCI